MTSRHGLEIRTATPADAAGLAELLEGAGHAMPERALSERLAALRHAWGTALVAVQWGPPSGLVVLHWYPTLDDARPTAQVTTLLVGAGERRRGIGRLLVKAASQSARAAGCGRLEVLAGAEDDALRGFCRATGFSEAGERFARSLRKQG